MAQNILLPQQQSHHHHHHLHQQQQQLLNHYQAAVAVAQQSLHARTGSVHSFIENATLDAHHHRSPLYPEFYHQTQAQQQAHTQALAKQYQQYYQTTRLLTDSVLAKYPPLGNLCKTVSQIGQTTPNTPPSTVAMNGNAKLISPTVRGAASAADSTSSPMKKQQKRMDTGNGSNTGASIISDLSATVSTSSASSVGNETSTSVQKTHQTNSMDSGMESSDDTKSESGSTKDENGSQWPAWIYCTRYSDRPSSGEHFSSFFFFPFSFLLCH